MGLPATREGAAVHPITMEIVDLRRMSSGELAAGIEATRNHHAALREWDQAMSDELIARMDAQASWTIREDGYEVSAPSPAAGTVAWPIDELEKALQQLAREGVISETAAQLACRRTLSMRFEPRLWADLHALAKHVEEAEVSICGEPLKHLSSDAEVKVSQRGLDALRKVPACAEVLDGVSVPASPPRRKATVKVKT